jgi:hypothetical protein
MRNNRIIMNKERRESYLEKNNLHYFNFPPNSEKPIKAVIHHFPQKRQWKIYPAA